MARNTRADEVYNARRRYRRQAERYSRDAENAVGAEKHRLMQQAANAYEKAMQTYQKPESKRQKASGLETLKEDLSDYIRENRTKPRELDTEELKRESERALSGYDSREEEARALLGRGNIGSRFYAGFVDLYTDENGDIVKDPNQAIMDEFGKSSMWEVLQELEDAGIDIYKADSESEKYSEVATAIQAYLAERQNA